MRSLILGTRGSELALAQTQLVSAKLRAAHPGLSVEERIIRTTGDARLDISLSAPGALDKGLFTKELEDALLAREIDAAVHSLKDLPTEPPAGLELGAILERESPADVLISRLPGGMEALPSGARVATSSLRRKCFLQWRRPDLVVEEIRGNVPTRIRKLAESTVVDAIVLAEAGLRRLRASRCPLTLDELSITVLDFMLPAPGQGAIAVESREGDSPIADILASIHHPRTAACVMAERAVLSGLGGGCHLPLGSLGSVDSSGGLVLRAGWFGDTSARFYEGRGPLAAWREVAGEVTTGLMSAPS